VLPDKLLAFTGHCHYHPYDL